jgi:exodeoxyribonuclease-5
MNKLKLNTQQQEAVARIGDWLKRRDKPYFYLAGYAGTGKSTLAAYVAEELENRVVFASFTGKAALVMQSKGCTGACTIDRLIYRPNIKSTCSAQPPCGRPPCSPQCHFKHDYFAGRRLNEASNLGRARLGVLDEVSMVGDRMGNDLLSFRTPIPALGDEAQLPPVMDTGFFRRRGPDFQLTEIHRQRQGSPVIELATRVRQGQRLPHGTYGDSAVLPHVDVTAALEVDQVICDTNRVCLALNQQIRKRFGHDGPTPQVGEKVLCLKNNRDLGLWNGGIWYVREICPPDKHGMMDMTVVNEDGFTAEVNAPLEPFTSAEGNSQEWQGNPFKFGYAITCHKAQGSQWGSVLVFSTSQRFGEDPRWLYTAITRAEERVVVVR